MPGRLRLLAEAIGRSVLPAGVAIASASVEDDAGPLWPAEAAAVASAVPSRQAEFAAGRQAVRRALGDLGLAPGPIPQGEDRAPVWPAGVTGSITHGAGICLAAVARTGPLRAIGIDLEPDAPLPEGLEAAICTPAERAWLDRQPPQQRARLGRLVFSAKEAAYKAQYASSRTLFGFDRLTLEFAGAVGEMGAIFTADTPPFRRGDILSGRYAISGGLVVTAFAIV